MLQDVGRWWAQAGCCHLPHLLENVIQLRRRKPIQQFPIDLLPSTWHGPERGTGRQRLRFGKILFQKIPQDLDGMGILGCGPFDQLGQEHVASPGMGSPCRHLAPENVRAAVAQLD